MTMYCPSCGSMNEAYAAKCSKCGFSLAESLSEQARGIAEIRIFSIIYMITAAIGTIAFIYQYLYFGRYSYGYFSSLQTVTPGQISAELSPYLYGFEIFESISAVITLASIFFLRSGYKILYKTDREFSSPLTGTTLIFISLAVLVISLIALIGLIFTILPQLSQNPISVSFSTLGSIMAVALATVVGLILLLIGAIMGLILGFHKLGVKYNNSYFDGAWILFLVSLFFVPAGLLASYLSVAGSNKTIKKLRESVQGETGV